MYQVIRTVRQHWIFLAILCLCSFAAFTHGAEQTQEPLLGTWQGELVINPSTKLNVQFIVRRDEQRKYAAVLNAPSEANLQNIPVSTVSATDGKVVFVVDEVNGKYEGTLQDGKIAGKWQQNGGSFDLTLAPYVKPRIPVDLAARLSGPWHGLLSVPKTDIKVPLVINFKVDPAASSGMSATIDSPSQAAFGIPAGDVSLQDGELSVASLRPKMAFSGKVEGNEIVGRWIQGGSAPLTFSKGAYVSAGLDVAKPIRQKLNGDWYGELSGGIGVALRFKEEPNGKLSAFLDSPHEGRRGIPLDKVSLEGSKLSLSAGAVRMSFEGTLTADAISGKFAANGPTRDLTLKHGEYVAETFHLTPDLAGRLLGKWEGKAANTYMTLRFQRNERGDLIAQQDIPNRQLFALPITDLGFDGQSLKLTVKGISAEFKGTLVKDEMSGDWTMPSLQFPLKLVRIER